MAETAVGEADAKKVAEARFRPVVEALGDGDDPMMLGAVYNRYVPDTPKVDF